MKFNQEEMDTAFRGRVKAQLALKGETMASLADRIGKARTTVSAALRRPDRFPCVAAAIEADLWPKEADPSSPRSQG